MDESKYGQLSALESYGQHDQLVYDGAHDVFGNEEHHQVSFLLTPAMRQPQALIQVADTLQDPIMAVRSCPNDRGDRQQWHALPALKLGRRGHRSRCHHNRLSRRLCYLH